MSTSIARRFRRRLLTVRGRAIAMQRRALYDDFGGGFGVTIGGTVLM
jgi:hypothetical protein